MIEMDNLVREFLTAEEMSLRNALAYGGLGVSRTSGQVNEIVAGIGFAEQQYSKERQVRMSEILGEMLFHWFVLASTLEIPFEEIVAEYIASYEQIQLKIAQEKGITLQDMLEMRKHVKPEALLRQTMEHEREKDWREKRKKREQMMNQ